VKGICSTGEGKRWQPNKRKEKTVTSAPKRGAFEKKKENQTDRHHWKKKEKTVKRWGVGKIHG